MENLVELKNEELRKVDGGLLLFWPLLAWYGGEQMFKKDGVLCDQGAHR